MPSKIEDETPVEIHFTCQKQEAYAFAQFLKRAQYSDFESRAYDEEDASRMMNAAESIQSALREAGFSPR